MYELLFVQENAPCIIKYSHRQPTPHPPTHRVDKAPVVMQQSNAAKHPLWNSVCALIALEQLYEWLVFFKFSIVNPTEESEMPLQSYFSSISSMLLAGKTFFILCTPIWVDFYNSSLHGS